MATTLMDFEPVRTAATRAAERVALLLREAGDGSTPVPGLDWTVGEVGAHLVSLARGYLEFAHGADSSLFSREPAEINAERLAAYTVRNPKANADALPDDSATFLAAIAADDSKMTLVGMHADRTTAAGALLAELLVHGLDIARANKSPWKIERGDALMAFHAGLRFLPVFVDPDRARGFTVTYQVRPRGGDAVTMAFTEGKLEISAGRLQRPDCIISGDPVTLLLVGYGRISQFRAALRGSIAYGRRPWLAVRFNKLLRLP